MAKPLVRGAVKTRLAAQLGDDEALAVYERLLLGTLAQAELLEGTDLVLAEAREDGSHAGPARRPAGRSARRPLRPAGAASRSAATRSAPALPASSPISSPAAPRRVVVVNSDSPRIPVTYLEQAFADLATAPAAGRIVLGPAADGGYYLIGHRRGDVEGPRGRRHRPPHLVTDEHRVAPGLHAARRARRAVSRRCNCRSGWTSTSPPISPCSRASTVTRRCAASRPSASARSTCTSRTVAAATAATATTRTPPGTRAS